MQRRGFLLALGSGIFLSSPLSRSQSSDNPRVSFTFDDPNLNPDPEFSPQERNQRILDALMACGEVKAALFVCGKRIDSDKGHALVSAWDTSDHIIANHSYSHLYYHSDSVSIHEYSTDMMRCDSLLHDYKNYTKLFRFPYLKEGDTVEKRDAMRAFLESHGYANGAVTIDASDWYIDQRLTNRLKTDPDADLTIYREYYLNHIIERAEFYDDLAQNILGRSIGHTLLLHHNLLNALFLTDLIDTFRANGWEIIDAVSAYEDMIFEQQPDILPAGESLVWALAKESGEFDDVLRYPGEDSAYEKDAMNRLGL